MSIRLLGSEVKDGSPARLASLKVRAVPRMNVETHAFRDAFVAERKAGFALQFDNLHSRAAAAAPFVTQKHDDKHLCLLVFETAEAAEKEKQHFPASAKLTTREVTLADVKTFAATGYFGMPALVFLRDRAGASALL